MANERKGVFGFLGRLVGRGMANLNRIQFVQNGSKSFVSSANIDNDDIVVSTIDRVANTLSKTIADHRINGVSVKKSNILRLLNFRPNEIMPATMFYYMIAFQLFVNSNAIVFIEFDENTGKPKQLLPIDWNSCEMLQDPDGKLFVRVNVNGRSYTLPYESIIHLRRNFRSGIFGTSTSEDIQSTVNLLLSDNQGMIDAISKNGTLRAIIKTGTSVKRDELKAYQSGFVADYIGNLNTSGIAAIDSKAEFMELKNDYTFLDKDKSNFLRENIYRYFGVNGSIVEADFSEEQYTAFIEMTIEPILRQMNEEFTFKLFTESELVKGNTLTFRSDKMQAASIVSKGKLVKIGLDTGAMTLNEARSVLDLPKIDVPLADTPRVSLNNVDVNLVSEYQIERAKGTTTLISEGKIKTFKDSKFVQFDYFYSKSISEKFNLDLSRWGQVRDRIKADEELSGTDLLWLDQRENFINLYKDSSEPLSLLKLIEYGGVATMGAEEMKSVLKNDGKEDK